MSNDSQQIVNKAWNFAHVLRDDGLSYMAYTEQITFLLFLKMADEQSKPPYNKPPIVPAKFNWESLLKREGDELEAHYRHCLEELGKQPGMLGEIFKKARPEIHNPATLRRLIVDLIDVEKWSSMDAEVKGDIYEGLLAKSAAESPKGAGQYFTPRELIKAIVDCVQPTADDTVCDPAAGTGGFLLSAYDYVVKHQGKTLDKDQKKHLRTKFVKGWELVPNTARLCIMNLYLHGIDADPCPLKSGVDSLASDPGERFSVVLTNPPFGKKSSINIVNEAGDLEKDDTAYERQDFWTTTKNSPDCRSYIKSCPVIAGVCGKTFMRNCIRVPSGFRHMRILSATAATIIATLIGSLADAKEPKVHLIDAHGISVTAIVPETQSRELLIELDFTMLGRDLLLESGSERPELHKNFAKLGPGDEKSILKAVAQCRRWHDHFFDGKEFPAEQLRAPELTVKNEITIGGNVQRYTGKCPDGYWLTFRKPKDTVRWRFDAGHAFKGERAMITVQLQYDHLEEGNLGQVQADGKPVFVFDPRENSYEKEFLRRFTRSRLGEQIDTQSFQLAKDRLRILLGKKFDIVLGILRTHPSRTSHRLTVRPGIYAANSYIKAIEVMNREKLLVESSRAVEGETKTDESVLLLPGAMLVREQLAGKLAVKWADKKESEKESMFRVEFGKLNREITEDRSAYLYLCVLHQAMSGLRYSTPDKVKNMILDDVLAEGEWTLAQP